MRRAGSIRNEDRKIRILNKIGCSARVNSTVLLQFANHTTCHTNSSARACTSALLALTSSTKRPPSF